MRGPGRAWFGALTMVLNVAGTLLIIVMALAVNADVIGRDLFDQPIAGVTEFLGLAIVAVVFLQMANTLREDRHIANDLIMAWVARRHVRTACAFYGLFHVIGGALMALIVWYVLPILVENYEGGYYKGTGGIVEIPVWPFLAVVVLGAAVSAIQYLLHAWREFRGVTAAR